MMILTTYFKLIKINEDKVYQIDQNIMLIDA